MIIELGALFATYIGVRIAERLKAEEKEKEMQAEAEKALAAYEAEQQEQGPSSEHPEIIEPELVIPGEPEYDNGVPDRAAALAQAEHYAQTSSVAMLMFALRRFAPALGPLGFATYAYSAIPYMRDVEKALVKDKKINADVLFFTADMLTLGVGQYFTAALGLWLMHSGKMSIHKAIDTSEKVITNTFEQLPKKVWVLVEGREVQRSLKDIAGGDLVVVGAGEVIPVDGRISEGMASIDQRALTGESQPAEKGVGDSVYANTILLTGKISVRVEKSGAETTAAKVSDLLLHSAGFKSQVQLKGEQWADRATLPMLLAAAVILPTAGPVPTAVFINGHIGNRIRLLAPLGTLKHISVAARHGILVKDGRALETLGDVDTVLFDKTGTLTTDEPRVAKIYTRSGFTTNKVLRTAAVAEGKLNHPIARAIISEAESRGLDIPSVDLDQYKMGYGITLRFEGSTVRVGSPRFVESEGIPVPDDIQRALEYAHGAGNTLVLVAVDKQVAGAVMLEPQVRPEVSELVAGLRARGIQHLAIVSGDHRKPTQRLAEALGMDEFFHDVLPDGKSDIVAKLQAKGRRVCFVGDGINDAVAMQQADVSISLAGANTIATDVAEIVLMDGSLARLNLLFFIAEKLDANLKRSLALTIAPGVTNVAGAFVFKFGILTSLLVNTAFGSVAMFDVMRPFKLPPEMENLAEETVILNEKGERVDDEFSELFQGKSDDEDGKPNPKDKLMTWLQAVLN